MNSAWWPDGWGKWWWHSKCQGNSPHPSNPASKPLTTISPTAPQFNTVLRIVRLLCSINLRAVSATFPHVEIRASSIIIVGFTVCGVHGAVWPTILPTSTLAEAFFSSTNSAAAATAHHHPQCLLPWIMLPRHWGTSPVQPSPVVVVVDNVFDCYYYVRLLPYSIINGHLIKRIKDGQEGLTILLVFVLPLYIFWYLGSLSPRLIHWL